MWQGIGATRSAWSSKGCVISGTFRPLFDLPTLLGSSLSTSSRATRKGAATIEVKKEKGFVLNFFLKNFCGFC